MKILQIIQYFSPQRGGPVNNVFNLTRYLQQRGHEVDIFTSDENFNQEYVKSIHPARVIALPSYFGLFRYTPGLEKALKNEISKYDVIHLNNYWSYQNWVVSRCARRMNIPYVLTPHGSLPIMMRGYVRKWLYHILIGNQIIQNAAKIIVVSNMEKDQALKRRIPEGKIKIIPNAVTLSEVAKIKKGAFRTKYNIGKDENIILFLGRIHPIKGVDLLVTAFAELVKKRADVRLFIVGPDENYLDEIKGMVNNLDLGNKVVFTGPLYNDERYTAYIDSDIYVLPSRYEIFAISVLEACASGRPVVVTENQGIADYIRGRAGEVVPFRVDALLQALEKLLGDKNLRAAYGNEGRKMVEDIFSWDKVINQYEQLYKEVVFYSDHRSRDQQS